MRNVEKVVGHETFCSQESELDQVREATSIAFVAHIYLFQDFFLPDIHVLLSLSNQRLLLLATWSGLPSMPYCTSRFRSGVGISPKG